MILNTCLENCGGIDILNIIYVFKKIISIITIIVPIILIIFVMVDIVKTITSGDVDTKKLSKSISKRLIAAIIVFLIFPITDFVLLNLPISNLKYIECYECATKDNLNNLSISNIENIKQQLESEINNIDSKETYNVALKTLEKFRVQIKNIYDKEIRNNYQQTYYELKNELNEKFQNLNNSNNNDVSDGSDDSEINTVNLFVGDSRTVSLCLNKKMCMDGNDCYSENCISQNSSNYSWFYDTAIKEINSIINNSSSKYNIIINMGVNDVGKTGTKANDYVDLFKKYATGNWKNHNVIIVSVNPVEDGQSNAYTSGVEMFNSIVSNDVKASNISNYKYCDTYNNLKFNLTDGLHYDNSTTNKIYDYIINNCI